MDSSDASGDQKNILVAQVRSLYAGANKVSADSQKVLFSESLGYMTCTPMYYMDAWATKTNSAIGKYGEGGTGVKEPIVTKPLAQKDIPPFLFKGKKKRPMNANYSSQLRRLHSNSKSRRAGDHQDIRVLWGDYDATKTPHSPNPGN